MPDMREEFEAYIAGVRERVEARGFEPLGDAVEKWMFHAWQASRAALRVELPPSVTIEEVAEHLGMDDVDVVDIAHMVNGAIAACAAFIKQAGIEVKP
ncbi:hypothetical protein NR640_006638 [Pseudomonas aeruginosa]|uniref:hypothetical protein n=1 Tax=Pseudomonas aeruginosa TaxID=287 RepID=UPI001F03B513|nr:hypothetical protein [Pseudomonas aeruginosa]EKT9084342.1 hypothetical protein [Pseudomonas aeruginosa]